MAGYRIGQAKIYSKNGPPLTQPEIHLLSCSYCKLLLRDPRQVTACGCRYCRRCIEQLTCGESSRVYTCIGDGTQYSKTDVRKDRGCQREIENIEVDCPTQPEPCSWRGKVIDMETHVSETCPMRMMVCSQGCGGQYRVDMLEEHMKTECEKRQVNCKYCKETISMDTLQAHYTDCQLSPGECPYCELHLDTKSKLSEHYDMCSKYSISCPYNECNFKSGKKEMNEHLMTAHIFQLAQNSATTNEKLKTLETENRVLTDKVCTLTSQVDELLASNRLRDAEIEKLAQLINTLQSGKDSRVERYAADDFEIDSVVRSKKGEKTANPQHKNEAIMQLSSSVEIPKVKSAADTEELVSRVQKMSESVVEVQNTIAQYGRDLEDIRIRQDVLDVKTIDGILVWKIPDLRRRYREAVERKTISLYSPPFYTGSHSYKVCIRLYLNGDGIGKGTHVSLFFFIMRSEHDNLLTWPFKQTVRFTLLHQTNPSKNMTEAFVPDPKSNSFKRPEKDMNVASGFPKFARQAILQDEGFTKDNLLFIKCQVDLSGLPVV